MKLTGPYLTLAGGLTVAGVLLALSINATKGEDGSPPVSTAATVPVKAKPSAEKPADEAADDSADEAADDTVDDSAADESAEEPEPGEVAPSGTYAGKVQGGAASVAISIKGDNAVAYFCDGKKIEAWVQGEVEETLSLKGKKGAVLNADYAGGKLSGTVKAGGKKWVFTVKSVKAPSGLYRAAGNVRNAKVVGGWIIAEGTQVGMVNSDGVETPAPPINLSTGKVRINGTEVQAKPLDGSPAR
jgi:hypothetical protein